MRRLALLLPLLLVSFQQSRSSKIEDALKEIKAEKIKEYVTWLAADEREGRNAGYAGNNKAGNYIAAHFKKVGLKPVRGTYFQPFEFRKRNDRGGPNGEGGKSVTRNVVAIIPGRDRKLKKEIVVIGAHYDHVGTSAQANSGRLGRGNDDKIWNGADDNGSGTATLMEIARVLGEKKLKPKRTILFIAFSAEEHGLLGSEHYCKAPLYPRGAHVAMINLDMVGKGISKLDISAVGTSDDWPGLIEKGKKLSGVEPKSLTHKYSPDSDHASFAKKKIPAIFFFTGLHADYHRPSDHADRLDYEGTQSVAKLAAAILWEAANAKRRPIWTSPSGKPAVEIEGLGVRARPVARSTLESYRIKNAGGLRVSWVKNESNAMTAKFEPGDIIIGAGGKTLDARDPAGTLKAYCEARKANRSASFVVIRSGRKKTLRVSRWK